MLNENDRAKALEQLDKVRDALVEGKLDALTICSRRSSNWMFPRSNWDNWSFAGDSPLSELIGNLYCHQISMAESANKT